MAGGCEVANGLYTGVMKYVADYYALQSPLVQRYLVAILVFVALSFVFGIFFRILLARFKRFAVRSKTKVDDVLVRLLATVKPPFYVFLALYLSFQFIPLNNLARKMLNAVLVVWVVYQAALIIQIVISYAVRLRVRGGEEESGTRAAAGLLTTLARGVLWTVAALLVLSNLGVDVTSLIAGLGIGGVAVALALQNILGDLFSSFALYFDKPFVVGDFIIVGDKMGVVQKIGIKTTRIRALQGEEIVIANKELTSEKIQNFKKMTERRVAFSFGVTYETPAEKIRAIPGMVQRIITDEALARFDRAHLHKFGDSALVFEAVYYLRSADYNAYMDTQQSLNFKILEAFERESIAFAYPTQKIHLAQETKVPPVTLNAGGGN